MYELIGKILNHVDVDSLSIEFVAGYTIAFGGRNSIYIMEKVLEMEKERGNAIYKVAGRCKDVLFEIEEREDAIKKKVTLITHDGKVDKIDVKIAVKVAELIGATEIEVR